MLSGNNYTTTNIAKILNVDTATIANWIDAGQLKGFVTPGGHRRVNPVDLYEFLKKNHMPIPVDLLKEYEWKIDLLIFDDNQDDLFLMQEIIKKEHPEFKITTVIDIEKFFGLLKENKFDLILIDNLLGEKTGVQCIQDLRKTGIETPVVLITGQDNETVARAVTEAGGQDYIVKQKTWSSLVLRLGLFKAGYFREMESFTA